MPASSAENNTSADIIYDEEEAQDQNNQNVGHDDADSSQERGRQRSLLKTLWSEATSTTDLPPPSVKDHHRLHHRRATAKVSPNATDNKDGTSRKGTTSPSKRRTYRVSRSGRRIAKRVWLAAFAAFAAAILIKIHVFLYHVFLGSSSGDLPTDNTNNNNAVAAILGKNGQPILSIEDQQLQMTLNEAHSHKLSSITTHPIDSTQYTIRINTWQRNEQLLLSINHHSRCANVAEIQVIWCDMHNSPPDDIVNHPSKKVKIEKHAINSLNERFKVLLDPPTLGILSLDDDVLRPCIALDAAFIRWTRHPDRMVGFDARTHVVVDDDENGKNNIEEASSGYNHHDKEKTKWKYGYMSTTESSNRYSMTLPRASFIHRDYLDIYTLALPREIYKYIAENLECEDIAMSFLVSSLTDGKPPLLTDYWSVKSMIKLYSAKKISGGSDHKRTRDNCVNNFAQLLGLKEDGQWPLTTGKLLHTDKFFGYGTEPEDWTTVDVDSIRSDGLKHVVQELKEVKGMSKEDRMNWLMKQKAETAKEAKSVGMVDGTQEWKERWEK